MQIGKSNAKVGTIICSINIIILISVASSAFGESYLEEMTIKSADSYNDDVNSVSWKPDGSLLAGAVEDGSLKLWNPLTGTVVKSIPVGSSTFSVDWSYTGETLVTLSSDGKVQTWDPVAGANTGSFDTKIHSQIFALSPNDYSIAIVDNGFFSSTIISVWNYNTGRVYYCMTQSGSLNCIAWNLDGNKVAVGGSDGVITIWDLDFQIIQSNMTSAESALYSIAWSPDGKMIVAGSSDDKVRIWEVSTGKIKKTMVLHSSTVESVFWSLDGKYIASGSMDKTTRIWNGTTGADVCNLTQHTQTVNCVAFSRDGKFLASGSDDGYVIIYQKEFIDIKIYSFSIDKTRIGSNEKCQISVLIMNNGNIPVPNQKLEYYDGDTLLETQYFSISNKSSVTMNYVYKPSSSTQSGAHILSARLNGVRENRTIEVEKSMVPQLTADNWLFYGALGLGAALIITVVAVFIIRRSSRRKTTVILMDLQSPSIQKSAGMSQSSSRRQEASQSAPISTSQKQQAAVTHQTIQANDPRLFQRQMPPAAVPQPASPHVLMATKNVELKSAVDFISGFLVIKVAVLNQSQYSLTRCSLSIDYNRKVFALDRVQPQTYEKDRSGDKVSIGEILPGDRRTTVEFYLDPYICTGGEVSAIFSYHDHLGQPHDIRLQPRKVDVLCPVLTAKTIDPSQLNSPSMWAVYDRLSHKNARAVNVTGMPMELAFELGCEVVERRDLRRVRKGPRPEGLVAWYYGKTPKMEGTGQEWDFLINVWRKPDCNAVEFMVAADSQGAITGLLSKLGEEFGEAMEQKGLPRPVTKVINITDSVIYRSSLECG